MNWNMRIFYSSRLPSRNSSIHTYVLYINIQRWWFPLVLMRYTNTLLLFDQFYFLFVLIAVPWLRSSQVEYRRMIQFVAITICVFCSYSTVSYESVYLMSSSPCSVHSRLCLLSWAPASCYPEHVVGPQCNFLSVALLLAHIRVLSHIWWRLRSSIAI